MRRFNQVWILAIVLLFSANAAAQPEELCPALVERALLEMGDNCGNLARNSACYGFDQVDSTFAVQVEPGFFSQPADRTELTALASLRTAPLDLETEQWGIAVMNVQANLPNTLPGQAVTFIVMGDAEIINAVNPEDALEPADPVTVTLQRTVDAFSSPTSSSNLVAPVTGGTTLEADALSREQDWLRVVVQNRPAWIPRDAIAPVDGLDALPVVTSASRTPMQAFYFTTGFGQPQCNEAPDVVAIQSPENLNVDLSVNGVDIRVGSTITLHNIALNQFALNVHKGGVQTVDGQLIEEGESIIGELDEEGNLIEWEEIIPLDEGQQELGNIVTEIINQVVPPPPDGPLIHIVQRGETLFGIARLYDTSMAGIIEANNLANANSIFVGQELIIPNPGSGFVAIPIPSTNTDDDDTTAGGPVDCRPFRATSPLDGLAAGTNTFYWDAAPGATGYRVIVSNLESGQNVVFSADGSQTSLIGNVDAVTVGAGFSFSWEVQALSGSQVVCTSGPIITQRGAPATPLPLFTASWGCSGSGIVFFSWSNLPAGQTVTFVFTEYFTPNVTEGPFSGASGTQLRTIATWMDVSNGVANTSGGASITLSPSGFMCP